MISTTLLIALPLLGATVHALPNPLAVCKADQGIVIPITKSPQYLAKRAGEAVDLSWLSGSREDVRFKFGPSPKSPGSLPTRGVGQESLSAQGSLWMGPITIGGQQFQIDFDTGSSDLFVPSSTCTTGGCVGHTKYTPSSTSQKKSGNFSIQYGDGSNSQGPIYTDSMTIAGLSITGQAFSPVTKMSDSFAGPTFPADGLAGMGFQGLAHTYSPPFFQTMVSQGVVSQSVFSFRIARTNSELYLGGINPSAYSGSLTYTPVTQQLYWRIAFSSSPTVNGSPAPSSFSSRDAIIDTGTTLVYGSYSDVSLLYSLVPSSSEMSTTHGEAWKGYYLFPCSSTPTMTLAFGGGQFQIPPAAMNLGRVSSGSSQCVGAVVGQDPDRSGLGNTFLVGDAFLQGNYAVFDVGNKRMGFAPLSDVPYTPVSAQSAPSSSTAISSRSSSSIASVTSSSVSATSSRSASSSSALTTSLTSSAGLSTSSAVPTTSATSSSTISSASRSSSTSTSTSISSSSTSTSVAATTSSARVCNQPSCLSL